MAVDYVTEGLGRSHLDQGGAGHGAMWTGGVVLYYLKIRVKAFHMEFPIPAPITMAANAIKLWDSS